MLNRVTVLVFLFFGVIFNVGYGGRIRRQGSFIWGTNQFELPTTTPAPTQQQSSAFVDCTRTCQTTSQYDPVCGSDRETYSNPQRLDCARKCGKVVQQVFRGSCDPL